MTRDVFGEMKDFCLCLQVALNNDKRPQNVTVASTGSTSKTNNASSTLTESPTKKAINNKSYIEETEIPVEALKKLKILYDAGIFSEEEFKEKKKQLLNL